MRRRARCLLPLGRTCILTAGHGCCWFRKRMRANKADRNRLQPTSRKESPSRSRVPTNLTSNKHGLFYKRPRGIKSRAAFFHRMLSKNGQRGISHSVVLCYTRAHAFRSEKTVSRGCDGACVPGVFCADAAAADGTWRHSDQRSFPLRKYSQASDQRLSAEIYRNRV